ncbi:homocysteine S-methyltransferase family protein [Bacillus sp. SL00103]
MSTITEQLKERILVLDGAMGTMIQNANLTAEDFGGEEYEGCNEYFECNSPHIIHTIHKEYLEASADLIETNTFRATKLVLDEYGLGHLAYELNVRAAPGKG